MNVEKKLALWEKEKFITTEQHRKIADFEAKLGRPILLYVLLFLAMFCIGIGVISVIASNWYLIPPYIKLLIDFILLLTLVFGIYKAKINGKNFAYEALIILYAIVSMATIGLVAQIYHLPSDGLKAVLFWSVITTPLIFYSKKALFPLVWIGAFFVSLIDVFDNFEWFRPIENFVGLYPVLSYSFMTLVAVVLYRACYSFYQKQIPQIISALKFWILVGIVWILFYAETAGFLYWNRGYYGNEPNVYAPVYSGLMALYTLGVGLFSFLNYKNRESKFWSYTLIAMLLFLMLLTFVPFRGELREIMVALYTLTMLAIAGIAVYNQGRVKLLNFISALIAFRFFIVYCQVFGSLLNTGIGLIISGLVFLGIAYVWHKTKIRGVK